MHKALSHFEDSEELKVKKDELVNKANSSLLIRILEEKVTQLENLKIQAIRSSAISNNYLFTTSRVYLGSVNNREIKDFLYIKELDFLII